MHPTALRVLQALQSESPDVHAQELAAELEMTPRAASRYLYVLEAVGWATHRTDGGAKVWSYVSASGGGVEPEAVDSDALPPDLSIPFFTEEHPPLEDGEAVVEAERCLQCGGSVAPAPCTFACPTGIDVPGFIRQIEEGRPLDAANTIFASNLLGGTCARVCPVEELCEGACVLDEEGRKPIEIGKLQRHATDKALLEERPAPIRTAAASRDECVGIIGAGPAGLTCAGQLAQRGYSVSVYEQRVLPGGLVTHAIAPYKQHIEPLLEEFERLHAPSITFHFDVTVGDDVSIERLEDEHDAVFLGVGMGRDYQTDLPGEDLNGVWDSLDFIEVLKLGPFPARELDGPVVVIGGGNTAIDVAREVVRLGGDARMVYRRNEDQMPAYPHEVEAARREGVEFEWLANPRRYFGADRVEGVQCIRMELGKPDASGRPRPQPVPGSEFVVQAHTVVKAIGQQAWWELSDALEVDLDGGRVQIDERANASHPGFFAGGDCVNGGATVVEAVEDGKRAAREIDRYLCGRSPVRVAGNGEVGATNDSPPGALVNDDSLVREEREDALRRYYQGTQYVEVNRKACKGCDLCITSCPVDILHLDEHDKIVLDDPGDCIFCGLCEARCPDFAIWVENEGALRLNVDLLDQRFGALS